MKFKKRLHPLFYQWQSYKLNKCSYKLKIHSLASIILQNACISDHVQIFFDDLNKKCNLTYSVLGRIRGLAKLGGSELGIN